MAAAVVNAAVEADAAQAAVSTVDKLVTALNQAVCHDSELRDKLDSPQLRRSCTADGTRDSCCACSVPLVGCPDAPCSGSC